MLLLVVNAMDNELKQLLSSGRSETYEFNPQMKNDINRTNLEKMVRDIRNHMTQKKKGVSVIVVKK
jgi:hypothetical protein